MVAIESPRPLGPREIRDHLGISRERMARLLDVSAKTVERWEQRGVVSENRAARRRLAALDEIVRLGLTVYTPEGFREFVSTPLPRFGNLTAMQLVERDEEERVIAALAADYEGLGY